MERAKKKPPLLLPIPENREQFLKDLYQKFREEFFAWSSREFSGTKSEAADVFQDAVIIFYQNIISGKVQHLEVTVKTYLFGIGKKLWLKKLNQEKNRERLKLEKRYKLSYLPPHNYSYQNEKHPQKDLIEVTIKKLGDTCQKIITLFYYYKYSVDAIKEELNLASAVSVRNRKRQCMLQLKKLIMEVNPS